MEATAIIGAVGAVLGIADVVTKSLKSLMDLQSNYQHADLKVNLLVGQVSTLRAALNQVAKMMGNDLKILSQEQLSRDLSTSLQGCEAILSALDNRLSNIKRNELNGLTLSSKIHLVWDDVSITDYQNMLNNQINALNLLLTALQWLDPSFNSYYSHSSKLIKL
jgi:hypothetical protein